MTYNIIIDEEWEQLDNLQLADPSDSPETLLIRKDIFKVMSDEAKDFLNLVLFIPEDYLTNNGEIKKKFLYRYCKRKRNWHPKKVELLKTEVRLLLNWARG